MSDPRSPLSSLSIDLDSRIVAEAEVGIAVLDREHRYQVWNRFMERLTGAPAWAVIGKTPSDLFPELASAEITEEMTRALAGEVVHIHERPVRQPTGEVLWTSIVIGPLRDDSGEIRAVLLVLRDITAHKRFEDALRRSEASFRAVIDRAPDPVIVNRGAGIVYVNPAGARLLGFEPAELIGRSPLELIDARDHAQLIQRLAEAQAGGATGPAEYRMLHRDGSTVPIESRSTVVEFEGESCIVTIARDLRERKALYARTTATERLSAMGLLAAGVAHEVNNPLAAVLANLEFVLGMLGPLAGVDARVERALAAIVDAADAAARIRDVTRDLRVFARADSEQRSPAVELASVLDGAIRIAQNEIRHRARLVREFGPAPLVAVDEPRLTQVFINLLVNAAHAIPEGRADAHAIVVRIGTLAHGRAVVEVIDDGEGMTPEVRARIFEPFFTTKPTGFGTGLGLAICRRIVESHGGDIEVESTAGAGTRVRVSLLPADATRVVVARAPEPAVAVRSRILVVDDDAVVASAVARILEADHVVEVATSSNDALDRIRSGARYDAIVCDVMMPNTTGMECHAEIERLDPALARRMVFVTGGAFTPAAQAFLDRAQNPKLEKPLDRRALAAALAKVMTPPAS